MLEKVEISCSIQIPCFKKHSVGYDVSKILNCIRQLWLLWMSPSKARAKSRERLLRTILFYLGHPHRQHERERPDMERKYINSDKVQ